MHLRRITLLVTAATALIIAGLGCGPSWIVVRQGSTPVSKSATFVVEPLRFEELHIGKKPEAEWLAKKNGEQRASWAADKDAINQQYIIWLMQEATGKGLRLVSQGQPGPGTVFIRATVRMIEPGYYAGISASGARFDAKVRLEDGSGVLEEIAIRPQGGALFSLGARVRDAGVATGRIAAMYLLSRVK